MYSKQDGTGIPDYAAETEAAMKKLGPGGQGNSESLADAEKKGVTPQLVKEVAERAETDTERKSPYPPANHDLLGPLDDA